jgi:signal transduction histidine kinase
MRWQELVERLGKYKELALAGVFVFIGSQELLEVLILELPPAMHAQVSLGVFLHLGQVLVILAGTYVFIKAWLEKTTLMAQEVKRSSELAILIGALREKEHTLSGMMERLLVIQEEERRLVAYDVHDCLAQLIVSAQQHLDTFEDLRRSQSAQADAELEKGLDRLNRAIVETRRLLAALHPGTLDSLGLIPALRAFLDETGQEAGWAVQLTDKLGDVRLPPTVETAVYRIVQEALANAAKHAKASHVTVELCKASDQLSVEVRDDGIGLRIAPAGNPAASLGLLSMKERARLLGGTCRVESEPNLGTSVLLSIPIKDETGRAEP